MAREALKRIEEADRKLIAHPTASLTAAIAHQRLGHAAEARRRYDASVKWSRSQHGPPLGWGPGDNVRDNLSYEALRREAEALIVFDPIFPADPFAR